MSQIILKNASEALDYEEQLREAAYETQMRIQEISEVSDPISFFENIKFNRIGCDPLNISSSWNVVEQINQTFTYMASFQAAVRLFQWHPSIESLVLNLGTQSGSDLEASCDMGIAAEVFAATHPNSNQKLRKDIEKVTAVAAAHKYVFFICPDIKEGPYLPSFPTEVTVWSLGQ